VLDCTKQKGPLGIGFQEGLFVLALAYSDQPIKTAHQEILMSY
jgi:hypothetical protein